MIQSTPPWLSPEIRGRLVLNASLAEYTSWRVGGKAEYLFLPEDSQDLSVFLAALPASIPVTWLGLGSNVLVRDGGILGVVIVTQGRLAQMSQLEADLVSAEAGVSCASFARYVSRLGLAGLEFMAGIPGTVGGALAMNAGCYGGETWKNVVTVKTINRQGVFTTRAFSDYDVGYRCVVRPEDEWFVSGCFRLPCGDRSTSLAYIKALLEKRHESQPTSLPNCGSVFRNPVNEYAAQLIEKCGLKRFMVGGAVVSEKHANFIINEGMASAQDIENLILHIVETVFVQTGIRLVPEVHFLGEQGE